MTAGSPDSLKPLRTFCQTVRLGSVSRAAQALGISQPAASLQLQALEREYAVPLLDRGGRRLVPTAAGERLFELARPLLEGFDQLAYRLHECLQASEAGALRIVADSATALRLLAGAAAAFRDAQPKVRLALVVAGPDAARAQVLAGDADLAFVSDPAVPAELAYTAVYASTTVLVAPPGHPLATTRPLSLHALSGHDMILAPHDRAPSGVAGVFARARLPCRLAFEVDDAALTKQYVAMGLGVSLLDAVDVDAQDRQRLAVRPVGGEFPRREFGYMVRRGQPQSLASRAFVALVGPDTLPRRDGCAVLTPDR